MSDGPVHQRIVEIAEARSTAARARLANTLSLLQSRLSPKALAQEAASNLIAKGQEIASDGVDAAKRHPFRIAGALAAAGVVLARRPLSRLLTRSGHATPADRNSLNSQHHPTPAKAAARRKPE
ncbi:hypothetical protein ASG11_10680 [Sphingomonas sp. Leaf357]|uniref:DUF3618 domain-containing protein n=1 Tax=Sphingomonas sp. Leaf357 TaxID=1736350 RepID=UPI0006FD9594|nr:DUF3618 domain-containing protein [Sphingomonas sp. Leaf357]KQS04659.1 hypothetical protein ASG11_10680 [Sphingomonas sp. Leaf357]